MPGTSSPPSSPPSDVDRSPGRLTPSRVLIAIAIVGMVGMWVYVVYLAVGPGRQGPPDELEDPAFAAAAQERCSEALDVVAQLPRADQVGSSTERADVVDEANVAFDTMLDDLAALAPPGEDGEIVAEWIADWRVYLEDRAQYADALREDPEARFLVSPKDGQHITEYLDAFAKDNRMPACSTPLDVS